MRQLGCRVGIIAGTVSLLLLLQLDLGLGRHWGLFCIRRASNSVFRLSLFFI